MNAVTERWVRLGFAGMAWLLLAQGAVAGDHAHPFFRKTAPSPRTEAVAGYPFDVKDHAIPSRTNHYDGYYVGGGSAIGGFGPRSFEGTWGWDYVYHGKLPKVRLGFSRGRRYQDGIGHYATDGPKFFQGIGQTIHHDH